MTKREAAMIYKKALENPNLTVREIISEVYKKMGKTPEEIDIIFSEYRSIIQDVEAKGMRGMEIVNFLLAPRDTIIESKNEDGITKINISEGFPKFDPSGKTDVKNTAVSTNVPTFGDENIEIIEPINTQIDPVIFGDTPSQNTVKSNEPVNFPNTESGLVIGNQKPVEPVRTDDFTFGEGQAPKQVKTNEPVNFPNTESGLIIGDQKPVEPVRTDDFTFGDSTDTFRPILPGNPNNLDFPNSETNGPDVPPDDVDSALKF